MSPSQIDKCILRVLCLETFVDIFDTIKVWRSDKNRTKKFIDESDIFFAFKILFTGKKFNLFKQKTKTNHFYYSVLLKDYLEEPKDALITEKNDTLLSMFDHYVNEILDSFEKDNVNVYNKLATFKNSKKINYKLTKCKCGKNPTYGKEGERPIFCEQCKTGDVVSIYDVNVDAVPDEFYVDEVSNDSEDSNESEHSNDSEDSNELEDSNDSEDSNESEHSNDSNMSDMYDSDPDIVEFNE